MLDFMFAVTHPAHFHSINMQQFPGHYPLHARVFGSSYVRRLQEISPGVWFNPYVTMNGVVRMFENALALVKVSLFAHHTTLSSYRLSSME
jgi:hypothetical protein